jgi:hypothetical protein
MGWFIISPDVRFRVYFALFVWDLCGICVGFSMREFVAVPLYHFRAHLHCGMPATGRELAQLQRLNSHHSQDC